LLQNIYRACLSAFTGVTHHAINPTIPVVWDWPLFAQSCNCMAVTFPLTALKQVRAFTWNSLLKTPELEPKELHLTQRMMANCPRMNFVAVVTT
jgi:hypothetical protein